MIPVQVDSALAATLSLALTVVAVGVVLAVHERGHAVGGLIGGWRVQSLVVGPLRLMRERGRLARLAPHLAARERVLPDIRLPRAGTLERLVRPLSSG